MHRKFIFYTKAMRYSCLLGYQYKFIANVGDKDHKITKHTILLHRINIRMLHLKGQCVVYEAM